MSSGTLTCLIIHGDYTCQPCVRFVRGWKGGQASGAPLSPTISSTHVQVGRVKTINSLHSGSDLGNGFLVHVSTSWSCKRIGISFQTSNDSNRLENVPQNVSTNWCLHGLIVSLGEAEPTNDFSLIMGMDADFWRKEKIIAATGISQKIIWEKFFGNKCLDSTWFN